METLHRMQKETTEAFNYLEKHPNGIPYMCGYKDGVSDLESWVEGDYLSGPKVYEAWNEEDAKMQFLIEQRKYNLYYFYESEFLTEFAEYLYYDELKGIIEENMVDKENLLKYVDKLNAKYFPDSDSVKISEEEFVDIFINEIDKKNLFDIMGNINFEIFWRRCMLYKIYAIADVKAKEYLNYCV